MRNFLVPITYTISVVKLHRYGVILAWRFFFVCVAAYSKNQLLLHPKPCSIYGRVIQRKFEPHNDDKLK
jgi:hypothetical protein